MDNARQLGGSPEQASAPPQHATPQLRQTTAGAARGGAAGAPVALHHQPGAGWHGSTSLPFAPRPLPLPPPPPPNPPSLQVSLVGHSAGAHLCTMALLHRALEASGAGAAQRADDGGSPTPPATPAQPAAPSGSTPAERQQLRAPPAGEAAGGGMDEAEEAAAFQDGRMPQRLVALAGVYDISKHYEYEEGESRCAGGVCAASCSCTPGR